MMRTEKIGIILLLILLPAWGIGQDQLPVPASPGSWVNDYADIFSEVETSRLDRKLGEFEYRSSTQIFVVTLDDNGGYPANMLAPMIGEAWGVGQQGQDNGIVILVDMQDRDMHISTGYGNEEYVTDYSSLGGGDYTAFLKVTDDEGEFDTTSIEIAVAFVNHNPVADADGLYYVGAGEDLVLDASSSTNPDIPLDSIVSYE